MPTAATPAAPNPPPDLRVGHGHDTHRTAPAAEAPDRPLVIGGVVLDAGFALVGHSDADVLLHAVTDALLGAAGRGDIGEWFPDDAAEWKDADSAALLAEALRVVTDDGWAVSNLDCTVHAERPKLTPHKPAIRTRLAALLGLSEDRVNVKAKSGEGVGPVGRGEAVVADAVVLLTREAR